MPTLRPVPAAPPLTLVPETGAASTERRGERAAIRWLLISSVVLKLVLAAAVTGFVLVDDAYIHLRYARNLVEHGEFVYNRGEAVFGLTSPLYGLIAALLYGLTGAYVEVAVVVVNVALWTAAAWMIATRVPSGARLPILAVLLFWPSFVDNQMLGMETPLFVCLLLAAMFTALEGRVRTSAAAYGLALITRPEALLLAPCLLAGLWMRRADRRAKFKDLVCPISLVVLLGPGLLWAAYSLRAYGGVIPQSMLAKTGWNSEHYDALFTWTSALWTFPRLTLLPFVDYLPLAAGWACTIGLLALVGLVLVANVRSGSRASRVWLGFYAVYIAFYLAGKGATEASWYSIPSSCAFLLAAEPLARSRLVAARGPLVCAAATMVLALASVAITQKRAPLLRSYVEGYGRAAEHLASIVPGDATVLIGEIGVYGFESPHRIVDVGALVSPEVLPMKNAGYSLVRMIRETGAGYFVISERALETNEYPSVGLVWEGDGERAWLESCELVSHYADKKTFRAP